MKLKSRLVTAALAGALIAMPLLGVGAVSADAAPIHAVTSSSVTPLASSAALSTTDSCTAKGVVEKSVNGQKRCAFFDPSLSSNLSATRWGSATETIISNYSGSIWSGLENTTRSSTTDLAMGMGNLFFQVGQSLVEWGATFDPVKVLGAPVDIVAAQVGSVIVGGVPTELSIGGALVVFGVIAAFFQARRSRASQMWRRMGAIAISFAFISVMVAGASATTGSGTSLKPGFMSPSWIASETSTIGAQLGSVPAAELLQKDSKITDVAAAPGTSCNTYLTNLQTAYDKGYQSGISKSFDEGAPAEVLSGIYTDSAVLVWKSAQFGNDPISSSSTATYGDEAFCHVLDWNASISPRQQALATFNDADILTNATPTGAGSTVGGWLSKIGITTDLGLPAGAQLNLDSAAWGNLTDSPAHQAASAIAWAACSVDYEDAKITVGVRPAWDGVNGISASACQSWWLDSASSAVLSPFKIGDGDIAADFKGSTDTNAQDVASAAQFVSDLNDGSDGSTSAPWAFALAALVIMIAFGGMGIALLIAKTLSVISTLALIVILLKEIASPSDGGVAKWAKSYAATALVTFGATLILAVVSSITAGLVQAGPELAAPGSTGSLIWIALSPALAIVAVLGIMKMTKLPNLFKPSGHLAFAAPALAGMVGAQRLVERAESKAASKATSAAKSAVSKGARDTGSDLKGLGVNFGRGAAHITSNAKQKMQALRDEKQTRRPDPSPQPGPTSKPKPKPEPGPTPVPRPNPDQKAGKPGPRDANGAFPMWGGGRDSNGNFPMPPAGFRTSDSTPTARAAATGQQKPAAPTVARATTEARQRMQARRSAPEAPAPALTEKTRSVLAAAINQHGAAPTTWPAPAPEARTQAAKTPAAKRVPVATEASKLYQQLHNQRARQATRGSR